MLDLLQSATFWIFGGGIMVAIVAIITDHAAKIHKLRAQERERVRQHEAEVNRQLFGAEADQVAGLKLRVEALEKEVDELRQLQGLRPSASLRVIHPPAASSEDQTQKLFT